MPSYAIIPQRVGTEVAGADLSNSAKLAVKMGANGWDVAAAGAGGVGVLYYGAVEGEACSVGIAGGEEAIAGAAIAKGASVEVGTGGKFITLASGEKVGTALTAASGDGSEFTLLVNF